MMNVVCEQKYQSSNVLQVNDNTQDQTRHSLVLNKSEFETDNTKMQNTDLMNLNHTQSQFHIRDNSPVLVNLINNKSITNQMPVF